MYSGGDLFVSNKKRFKKEKIGVLRQPIKAKHVYSHSDMLLVWQDGHIGDKLCVKVNFLNLS